MVRPPLWLQDAPDGQSNTTHHCTVIAPSTPNWSLIMENNWCSPRTLPCWETQRMQDFAAAACIFSSLPGLCVGREKLGKVRQSLASSLQRHQVRKPRTTLLSLKFHSIPLLSPPVVGFPALTLALKIKEAVAWETTREFKMLFPLWKSPISRWGITKKSLRHNKVLGSSYSL